MNKLYAIATAACLMLQMLSVPLSAQLVDLRAVAQFPDGQNNFIAGNTFKIEIKVGESVPAQDLYGISFVLNFDSTLVTALSAKAGDFLGSSILFLPVIEEGRVAVGMTGTSGSGIEGSGLLAEVILMVDDKAFDGGDVNIYFSEVKANNPNGDPVSVDGDSLSVIAIAPSDPPDINLSATVLDLDRVVVGDTATATLIISNAGLGNLTIHDISSSNEFFTVLPSSGQVLPNSELDVSISFSPNNYRTRSAVLTIFSNDPDEDGITLSLQVVGELVEAPGDIDQDGTINIFDILGILKAIKTQVTVADNPYADCDNNGKVDIFDLLKMLRWI